MEVTADNSQPRELPLVREQHGFRRTGCACAFCQAPCRHIPGSLDVVDLLRLCPPEQNLFAWAEQHLCALVDKPFPTLVPARQPNGHCHWLFDGRCAVHEFAPYSCAFFDAHMTEAEANRRSAATIQARLDDEAENGLYVQVWRHLRGKGLVAAPGDLAALNAEVRDLRRNADRNRRRLQEP